ncbi:hypothetical protein [Streptomyces sp. NPDC002758]
MARFEMNDLDRYRIGQARDALAESERLDMSDDKAMAREIGRLRAVLESLLEMVDEDGES